MNNFKKLIKLFGLMSFGGVFSAPQMQQPQQMMQCEPDSGKSPQYQYCGWPMWMNKMHGQCQNCGCYHRWPIGKYVKEMKISVKFRDPAKRESKYGYGPDCNKPCPTAPNYCGWNQNGC